MKSLRKHLSYSNVMSSIAVFLVLGGATAFAATHLGKNTVGTKQLKANAVTTAKVANGAITLEKISPIARAALKGATGPQGSPGAKGATGATGEAGTAKAYGLVNGTTGAVTFGKNMGSGNVQRIAAGGYCISGLSFSPENAMATPESPSTDIIPATGIGIGPSVCPGGTQVRVFTKTSGGVLTDANFFILIN